MDLIRYSMTKPVTITVGVILVVMFGLIGLGAIPVQLTPTVDRPIVTISTNWPGRSPQEVVDEITKEQEERLKNVANLKSMRSVSREGAAEITLEFYLGASITRALQDVSDSLRQVPSYPDEVDEPTIKAAEGAAENAIAWIIIDLPPEKLADHPGFDITSLYDALDKELKPLLERIDGVAEVNIYGGREREVRVLLDPVRLAQRGLSPIDVVQALQAENRNISAGAIAEGKRDYRVRVIGQFEGAGEVMETVIAYRPAQGMDTGLAPMVPVYVKDVGTVEIGHEKMRGFVRSLGNPCLAMNAIRQSGANVVDVMRDLRARLDEARIDILPRLNPDLRMRQVYDETIYIDSAIDLVNGNLIVGAILSSLALIFFLRSLVGTGLIALAIPISVIGTFLVMLAFGRTLNVISLAGLAFSTGVVVDNATVVLENIYRRMQLGDSRWHATYRGTKEVWAAIFASTLTTCAVFIPLLTIQDESGQLFRDLSLAISVSVVLSLVVAITVIPCAAARLLGKPLEVRDARTLAGRLWASVFGLGPLGAAATNGLSRFVYWAITGWRGWTVRPVLILAMTGASILGSLWLMPPMDYLPKGNRNLVFGGLLIPPGYSVDQMTDIAQRIESRLEPYVTADINDPASLALLDPIPRMPPTERPFDPVPVENMFIGAFNGGMFVGATSQDEEVVLPVGTLLTNAMNSIPDAFGFAQQSSIFGRGISGGNTVDIEISGPNLDRVTAAASRLFALAGAQLGYQRVRPNPANFNLKQPEWRVRLNDHGRELGLRTRDVGVAVRGLFDGAFVDDFFLDGDTVDLVILPAGGRLDYKEALASIPIATPAGRVVPLDSVVDVVESLAPQEIQRIEELPAVTVQVVPPEGAAVAQLMNQIREGPIAQLRAEGLLDPTMRVRLEGTAARLDEVRGALFGVRSSAERPPVWQRVLEGVSWAVVIAGLVGAGIAGFKSLRRPHADAAARSARTARTVYAVIGIALLGLVLGGVLMGIATNPQLLTARFVWALLVTYLLMAALFESFLYPFVIMFSVPPATVGGFAALAGVHAWTLADPTRPTQLLDVLTMLGFVMLVGTVVNNAILLVEQAINFMDPTKSGGEGARAEALPPLRAIQESVRTRVRPIMMTTLTTITGGLPLVFAPGAGSEMYRGLGAVVIGGLAVSTVFTLVLVPLVFSLTYQMYQAVREVMFAPAAVAPEPGLLLDQGDEFGQPARTLGAEPDGFRPRFNGDAAPHADRRRAGELERR